MHRRIWMLLLLLMFCIVGNYASARGETISVVEPICTESMLIPEKIEISIKETERSDIPAAIKVEELLDDGVVAGLSDEDIDLIALVTMAEAEGESMNERRRL